jgi:hypothetical protein
MIVCNDRVINMQKASSVDDLLKGKSSKPSEAGVGSGVIYQINNNSAYITIVGETDFIIS